MKGGLVMKYIFKNQDVIVLWILDQYNCLFNGNVSPVRLWKVKTGAPL